MGFLEELFHVISLISHSFLQLELPEPPLGARLMVLLSTARRLGQARSGENTGRLPISFSWLKRTGREARPRHLRVFGEAPIGRPAPSFNDYARIRVLALRCGEVAVAGALFATRRRIAAPFALA